jgi:hypothetical protein
LQVPEDVDTHQKTSQCSSKVGSITNLRAQRSHCCILHSCFNPFRSYVGPRPTLWFSCSRRFSWSLTLSNLIFLPPACSPGFPVSNSKCWDGSQNSKLPLHASHVALPK